ncbi:MAG: preprotein translocase subunit SecG [Candidatus Komeilibacteria bacterium RIFCSPLOWO2_02_FULL_48_11]|uniref:Protein-export membrane protein SecG n=1 Tax=Candidatus Komeilibacteria bacterium RIFCSPLOWO2_02_FULL_48_11 TaxID=1798553 RepID=A0A1G2BVD4_9BACT|nr:MAG: preprotein translocase subunit SecG [Candidatus Komeilibacteria bacterium RIFCSPLOWO2_02_FULL_48_11]
MIFDLAQIILAAVLVTAILLQSKGTGLGAAFGGGGNLYRTKRGAEKILYWTTISVAGLFFAVSLLRLFLSQ